MLGLPAGIRACLFDVDGVLTKTAIVHRAAWRRAFDAFLQEIPGLTAEQSAPFSDADYNAHVDGKPRKDGVRDFLASRRITLPEGSVHDGPDAATVEGVATRKNLLILAELEENGVTPYVGSLRYLEAARSAGLRIAAVTASANGEQVIEAGGFTEYCEARIDGIVAEREGLRGKPAPDPFLAGARALGIPAAQAAVFEDAISGVQAGRAGNFGFVVGVNRVGQAEALRANGADIVVDDLAELLDDDAGARS
ncbi:MAG: HAD-IA family hydrolase [Geodermatophilaceae bacterium]|nr:HAD-IA family hydrolase [Geodermatophilaceae bacterium]